MARVRTGRMDPFENTRQPDWDWWGRLWPAPGLTLQTLGVEPGDRLVEVGSGNGYFALPAARIVSPSPVCAVDLDGDHLAELSHLADQHGLDNVETVEGDARGLSALVPEPVDVALVANTLHGVDDPVGLVREVFDALEPAGRLVVVNWHDRPRESSVVAGRPRGPPVDRRMGPEETAGLIREAAEVRITDRVDLPPHHYGLVVEP